MNVFIYALCEPDTKEVRYIGKSNNPKRRLSDHLTPFSLRKGTYKSNWLSSLKSRGQKPLLEILEEVPIETWEEREKFWIKVYKEKGCRLTNHAIGGNGGPVQQSGDWKQEMSQRNSGERNPMFGNYFLNVWTEASGSEWANTRYEQYRKTIANNSTGKNNPMAGRYMIDIWKRKYGEEEALRKFNEVNERRRESCKKAALTRQKDSKGKFI